MRITRLYTEQTLKAQQNIELDSPLAHRLIKVMRLKTGDRCVLFNGDQYDYPVSLRIEGKKAFASLAEPLPNPSAPTLKITLVQAISKGDRMDFVMQKATELGVSAIQPVFSQYGDVKLSAERLAKKQQHWQSLIVSAAEQSGRAELPRLQPASPLDQLSLGDDTLQLVLSPRAHVSLASLQQRAAPQHVCLYIGPEGGFSDTEVDQLSAQGAQAIGLGPRVLRTETAALSALSVCQALWGDFIPS